MYILNGFHDNKYGSNVSKQFRTEAIKEIGDYAFAYLMSNTTAQEEDNKLKEINLYKEINIVGSKIFDHRIGLVINIERNQNEIPETWNENWNKSYVWNDDSQVIVNYGITMD